MDTLKIAGKEFRIVTPSHGVSPGHGEGRYVLEDVACGQQYTSAHGSYATREPLFELLNSFAFKPGQVFVEKNPPPTTEGEKFANCIFGFDCELSHAVQISRILHGCDNQADFPDVVYFRDCSIKPDRVIVGSVEKHKSLDDFLHTYKPYGAP